MILGSAILVSPASLFWQFREALLPEREIRLYRKATTLSYLAGEHLTVRRNNVSYPTLPCPVSWTFAFILASSFAVRAAGSTFACHHRFDFRRLRYTKRSWLDGRRRNLLPGAS